MKAAAVQRWGDVSGIAVIDVREREPGPLDVTVGVKFAGLNHLDIWVRRGMPFLKLSLPHVLGADAAGVVVKTGSAVTGVQAGDEVIVYPGLSCSVCKHCLSGRESLCRGYQILGEHVAGTIAERVVVPARNVFIKPESMSWETASVFGLVCTTAWQMIQRSGLTPGDHVLINAAASGVSSVLVQLAALCGAHVYATAGSEEKLRFAQELGAKRAWIYNAPNMHSEIEQLTQGRGCEVVFDHVGSSVWEQNLRCVQWGGKIVTCGATSGYSVALDLRQVFYRQLQIIGSTMGSKADFPRLIELVASNRLRVPLSAVYPLSGVQRAYGHLEERSALGKIAISIG